MKRTVAIAAALVVVAAGAVGIQRSLTDDGPGDKPADRTSIERGQLDQQTKEQQAQQKKALQELADKTKKRAEELKQSDPDR